MSTSTRCLFLQRATVGVGIGCATMIAAGGGDGHPPRIAPEGAVEGHPTPYIVDSLGVPPARATLPLIGNRGAMPLPAQAILLEPIATGTFINFESPPVRPMAVNAPGTRLYVANTPQNAVAVYNVMPAANNAIQLLRHIPVGLEPVTVAMQPGAGDRTLWVLNHLSDDISVVDTTLNLVTKVIPVGDEPVNIAFSAAGDFAWVVLQGPDLGGLPPFETYSSLVTIETASGAVVHALPLDLHTARGVAFDAANRRLIVAALHSGNNTTMVGKVIRRRLPNSDLTELLTTVEAVRDFGPVAHFFAQPNLLAPYPDTSTQPNQPPVGRIVPDAAKESVWAQLVSTLTDANAAGVPDAAIAAQYAAQFEIPVQNAINVLTEVINDAKDTVDHDLAIIDVSRPDLPAVERYIGNVGTTLTGLAFDAQRSRIVVLNMEAINTTRLTPNLRGHFIDHQVVFVDDYLNPAPLITAVDLHDDSFNDVTSANAAAQAISLANPVDVLLSPDGQSLFVAALGTGRVGVLDPDTGSVRARVDVGRGTRALAIDAVNRRLFSLDRTDHRLTQCGPLNAGIAVQSTTLLFNPEPPAVKRGRDFLYSTRLSSNFGSSCAMCHIDGNLDHLDWDLGGPTGGMLPAPANVACAPGVDPCLPNHPVKGPMFTQSLRGLAQHNPFHWRGDKPQFADFAEAFNGLLGAPADLASTDMAKFDAFVKTMVYPPNPYWNRDNSSKDTDAYPNGALVYIDPAKVIDNCQGCHELQHDGALQLAGSDGGFDLSGILDQIQEVPQLRGLYKKTPSARLTGFGLMHDGRIEPFDSPANQPDALAQFLRTFFLFPADQMAGTSQNFTELKAFLQAFPSNVTNVVGWQVRVRGAGSPQNLADIDTMIGQAQVIAIAGVPQADRCDVVAQGLIGGEMRGYVYVRPAVAGNAGTFRSDRHETFTLANLLSGVSSGYLVFMAVPPGSGVRIGIDADGDCDPNGLDPFPYSNPDFNENGTVSPQDLFDFLAEFFAGEPIGDFNHSGLVSSQDIFDFLAEFFKPHCPPFVQPIP